MNKTTLGMAVMAFILALTAFFQGGFPLVGQGFLVGGQALLGFFPLLVIAFTVAGLVSMLIPREMVSRWLGEKSGGKA